VINRVANPVRQPWLRRGPGAPGSIIRCVNANSASTKPASLILALSTSFRPSRGTFLLSFSLHFHPFRRLPMMQDGEVHFGGFALIADGKRHLLSGSILGWRFARTDGCDAQKFRQRETCPGSSANSSKPSMLFFLGWL